MFRRVVSWLFRRKDKCDCKCHRVNYVQCGKCVEYITNVGGQCSNCGVLTMCLIGHALEHVDQIKK